MKTAALSVFRTSLRRLYDAENQTTRHSDTLLNELANAGYRWLRANVTDWGYTAFLSQTTGTLSASAADTNEVYSSVAYPSGATQIHAVDVYDTPQWKRLQPISMASLRQYQDTAPVPEAWCVDLAGSVATTTFTTGRILIMPRGGTQVYKVWYLPEWSDLSTDTHLFLYQDELWLQLHLQWCVAQLCTRDQDEPQREQRALFEINPEQQGSLARRIRSMAPRVMNAGARSMRRSDAYHG